MKIFCILFLFMGVVYGKSSGNFFSWGKFTKSANDLDSHEIVPDSNGTNTSYIDRNAAVIKAAKYFHSQKDSDYGWGAFTPRAIVAVSFGSRVLPVVDEELMKKQLNVQLVLDLMQKEKQTTLSGLALYINALYATCQDPRNFHGVDLVSQLRWDTNVAVQSNLSTPLAYLTLCIAGEMTRQDGYDLANMYNSKEFSRTSSKALITMAMICDDRRNKKNSFIEYISNFSHQLVSEDDVYSKALYMQTMIAAGREVDHSTLASYQLEDGSFGDLLATYYAIPVLMNSSLLDLKCSYTMNSGMGLDNMLEKDGENKVSYSLWISTGKDVKSHSTVVEFNGEKSFYDVMLMAAAKDALFRFSYDESDVGKIVYSIAGIPNDSESGKSWKLYSGVNVVLNSVHNLTLQDLGIDKIFPEDRSHYVFWFKRD